MLSAATKPPGAAPPSDAAAATAVPASTTAAGGSGSDEKQPVREAPPLSALQKIGQLLDTNPNWLDVNALDGYPFAWSGQALYIADPPTVEAWMGREWQLGTTTRWPGTISKLLGGEALAITKSAEQHASLRKIFGELLTNGEVERMLPGIQATVNKYLADWAARGRVQCYTEMLTLVFDVLINEALQLKWSDADVKRYTEVFEVWNQGFTPLANPLPWSRFSKGMRARKELVARFRASLADPSLTPGSIPARLRDAYGAQSDVCTDNLIMAVFAGFETTCSLATGLLWHLSRSPEALEKVRAEQSTQPGLTLDSLKAMPFTSAAASEVLRLRQIVSGVPRVAGSAGLDLPRAPAIPSGCPLSVSWGGMSLRDPAVKGEEKLFRPERWLEPANASSLAHFQKPFGYGQHDCVGRRVATAIALAVAREVALKYGLQAEAEESFDEFPTGGRPRNGLPLTLTPLAGGA